MQACVLAGAWPDSARHVALMSSFGTSSATVTIIWVPRNNAVRAGRFMTFCLSRWLPFSVVERSPLLRAGLNFDLISKTGRGWQLSEPKTVVLGKLAQMPKAPSIGDIGDL